MARFDLSQPRCRWLALAFVVAALALSLTGGCKELGKVSLKLSTAGGQDLSNVETLSFHFQGNGLLETPQPYQVSVGDGAATIPSLSVDENATDQFFAAQVFGLDSAGKVAAYGALRLPLTSRTLEYTLFMTATEQFVRLTKLDSPTSDSLMPQSIVGHQVVPLPDGRILIAGGATRLAENKGLIGVPAYNNMIRNLLIYNPVTGIFDVGPQLGLYRAFHTATLLSDGRVLLAGGITFISSPGPDGKPVFSPQAVQICEIYDPSDESLIAGAGRMAEPRAFHTASLLKDGSILFVGGLDAPIHNEKDKLKRVAHQITKLEIYRPDLRSDGQVVGDLAKEDGRFLHGAVTVDEGKVLVAGGMQINSEGDRVVLGTSLLLKRDANQRWSWKRLVAASSKARYDHQLVKATIGDNTWAIAVGGRDKDNIPVGDIEIYRADGKMFPGGTLKVPRYGLAGVFMKNRKLLVIGGLDSGHKPVLEGEVYTVEESGDGLKLSIENITPKISEGKGRYKPAVASSLFDARVFVVGGSSLAAEGKGEQLSTFVGTNTVELYTPLIPVPTSK